MVIDVVPLRPGVWLARCECGATEEFPDAAAGWEWVLAHPCPPETVDVTDPVDATDSARTCRG